MKASKIVFLDSDISSLDKDAWFPGTENTVTELNVEEDSGAITVTCVIEDPGRKTREMLPAYMPTKTIKIRYRGKYWVLGEWQ